MTNKKTSDLIYGLKNWPNMPTVLVNDEKYSVTSDKLNIPAWKNSEKSSYNLFSNMKRVMDNFFGECEGRCPQYSDCSNRDESNEILCYGTSKDLCDSPFSGKPLMEFKSRNGKASFFAKYQLMGLPEGKYSLSIKNLEKDASVSSIAVTQTSLQNIASYLGKFPNSKVKIWRINND